MSTTVHNTNKACCSIPPVQSDYIPKGTFKPVGDFARVYVTGPETSENALVCVFDIFGFFPQTLQGADILAAALNATVYMPDMFEPNSPFPIEKFPPKTDEEREELQRFFATTANTPANVTKLLSFGRTLRSSGIKNLGVYGFCWGGKVVILSGGENTPFYATAMVHPANLSGEDARQLAIPLGMYISKDEPIDEYKQILHILSKKPFAEKCDDKLYSNMFHGWAAARGDLENPENREAYDDVYGKLAEFFKNAGLA